MRSTIILTFLLALCTLFNFSVSENLNKFPTEISASTSPTCHDVDMSYNITYPKDLGIHINQTYEYFWFIGRLNVYDSTHTQINTIGYLIGINRLNNYCHEGDDNYLIVTSLSDTNLNKLSYETAYYEKDAPYMIVSDRGVDLKNIVKIDRESKTINVVISEYTLNLTWKEDHFSNIVDSNPKSICKCNDKWMHVFNSHLELSGSVTNGLGEYEVSGEGFEDHYIINADKPANVWLWFYAQFDNNYSMMINRNFITGDNFIYVIDYQGNISILYDYEIHHLRYWRSPVTNMTYPIANRIYKKDVLDIYLSPLIDNNEITLFSKSLFYEGVSDVMGQMYNKTVAGIGTSEIVFLPISP